SVAMQGPKGPGADRAHWAFPAAERRRSGAEPQESTPGGAGVCLRRRVREVTLARGVGAPRAARGERAGAGVGPRPGFTPGGAGVCLRRRVREVTLASGVGAPRAARGERAEAGVGPRPGFTPGGAGV